MATGKIAAHSAYAMFSWYQYLIVGLVFSHLGFWSGNLFLTALIFAFLYLFIRDCLSETDFYGDLVYKFNNLVRRNIFFFSV